MTKNETHTSAYHPTQPLSCNFRLQGCLLDQFRQNQVDVSESDIRMRPEFPGAWGGLEYPEIVPLPH